MLNFQHTLINNSLLFPERHYNFLPLSIWQVSNYFKVLGIDFISVTVVLAYLVL